MVVMFKFRPEVTQEHKDTFVRELKRLKKLDCVKGHGLVVGGPSVTDPIERSKGFEIALLSFHESSIRLAKRIIGMGLLEPLPFMSVKQRGSSSLATIRVTSTYMFPYKDLTLNE
jgi:hypothetical protein